MSLAPATTLQPYNNELRRRVAPLCHAIRLSALVWIIWASVATFSVFGSKVRVAEHYGRVLHADLTSLPTGLGTDQLLADVTISETIPTNLRVDVFGDLNGLIVNNASNSGALGVTPVPEPASLVLFGTALLWIGWAARRR